MKYLLDTNACIALINQKPPGVRVRLDGALAGGAEIFVSSIVEFELWYGVAKSAHHDANSRRVEAFFSGPVRLLPFDEGDARSSGKIRASLEAAGRSIGAYDLLIAGQAVRRQLTLITANAREFARVKGLVWEDWAGS